MAGLVVVGPPQPVGLVGELLLFPPQLLLVGFELVAGLLALGRLDLEAPVCNCLGAVARDLGQNILAVARKKVEELLLRDEPVAVAAVGRVVDLLDDLEDLLRADLAAGVLEDLAQLGRVDVAAAVLVKLLEQLAVHLELLARELGRELGRARLARARRCLWPRRPGRRRHLSSERSGGMQPGAEGVFSLRARWGGRREAGRWGADQERIGARRSGRADRKADREAAFLNFFYFFFLDLKRRRR